MSHLNRVPLFTRVAYDVYLRDFRNRKERKIPVENQYSLHDKIAPLYKPSLIIDNIYVGNVLNSVSSHTLESLNIKYIINVTKNLPNRFPEHITYYNIPIDDNNSDRIDGCLGPVFAKILEYQRNNDGNILIHCFAGMSRSVSVATYYLVKKYNMTVENALKYIKQKRYIAQPTRTLINCVKVASGEKCCM